MLRVIIYCLTLLLCLSAHAQILPFKTYTTKDGMLSQQLNVVTRDEKGILWIGTPFGVNWFDGQRFTEPAIKSRTGQLYITNFLKDSDEKIWILTFYNGIYKYENDRFTNYLIDSTRLESTNNNVLDMVQYDEKNYIVATDNNIYWFDGKTFRLFDPENKQLYIQFGGITHVNQDLVFFSSTKGIFEYKRINNKWTFIGKILQNVQVSRIFKVNSEFWAATPNGLYIFRDVDALRSGISNQILFKNENISSVTSNKITGEVWVCGSKLYKLKDGKTQIYDKTNGLQVSAGNVYCDYENVIWLCTSNGLVKLAAQNYVFHDLTNKNVNSMVTTVALDNDGQLWIGTYDGLVLEKNDVYKRFDWVDGKRIAYVAWLYNHPSFGLLAGTTGGIIKISGEKIILLHDLKTSRMFSSENGEMFVGTENGKVFSLSNDKLKEIQLIPSLIDFIDGIYKDNKNNLWIGYRGAGIRKYNGNDNIYKLTKEYSSATGYKDLRIRYAGADQHGNIIWGTRTNGLFVISANDDNKVWNINSEKGLSANWVKSVGLRGNSLYLATNKGVNVLNGSYDSPQIKQIQMINENVTDETTFIYPTEKNILIGTEQGILEYIPSNDISDTIPPRVYFTQLTVNGKPDTAMSSYSHNPAQRVFDHNQNVMAFEFAGISMKNENPVQYSYMLEGQDNEWTEPNQRNFVSYNLPSGKYRFLVRARNSFGVWSHEPASFSFVIATPFWKQWWFAVVLVFIAVALLSLIYRYRIQQALKLERLRSRISTDLHDDIGSTLSSISILSEMALKEKNTRESEDMMMEIKNNSVSLMEKMDDIVWSINPKNDSLENLLVRIKSFAARLFEAKNIEYVIKIDDSVKNARLSMESRQHIYMMLKESINNIVKYSGCTHAGISVKYDHSWLDITVTDNGRGFDKDNVGSGNGLLNMKNRAQMMKAQIRIESAPGAGTSIAWSSKIK